MFEVVRGVREAACTSSCPPHPRVRLKPGLFGSWHSGFCYLIKNKERQLPNKPYVGFWVGKAGNLNNLNIGVDPGEGVGPGI